jgi:DNA-binding IclR family transcriptional regulator
MHPAQDSASATLRAFAVIESVVAADRPISLTEVMAAVALPKPTAHRILALLERAGLIAHEPDGKRYIVGPRLARLGSDVLMHSSLRGARRAILHRLVDEVGETCNFTMLDGDEVIYLDRVETASPLRVNLQPGSHVPLHCTASGKLFLAMLPRAQRNRLLDQLQLTPYTANTLIGRKSLEQVLERIRRDRISTDDEEYLTGLVCVAVPITDAKGRTCASVAVHAPVARMPLERALQHLPTLRRAAEALAATLSDNAA